MSPVPEPASALLRRLHEEATPSDWSVIEKQKTYGDKSSLVHNAAGWVIAETPALAPLNPAGVRNAALIVTLRNALPALADLVQLTEEDASICTYITNHDEPCPEPLCRALAALRERLGAKP